MELADYNNEFGDLDLFLLDLLLKGYVKEGADVLDAGCGAGRNTFFFLTHQYNVKAIDIQKSEVNATNLMSRLFSKGDVAVQADLAQLPFENDSFDFIVCSRVLHFAKSKEAFDQMMKEIRRVLRRGGILYLSMNSCIGNDKKSEKGTRFLLTIKIIEELAIDWNRLLDNRTVLFENNNGETTLILSKK